MKISKVVLILLVIVIVGAVLRLYQIDKVPMYGDELTAVYDSYSLLKTGKDQLGDSWPLTFKMGAGRPAGYVYGSIPFVAILGPTELGIRMLSVLSGLGLIILVYLLGKQLVNEKAGLWSALLMSVSPWSLNLSRGGFEANLALLLVTLGVWLFLQIKERPWFLILAVICFGLTIHTYPTYKLTLPFLILLLGWFIGGVGVLRRVLSIKYRVLSIFVAAIFIYLAIIQTLGAGSEARFGNINIWQNQDIQQKLTQKINDDRASGGLAIFHNRYLESGKLFLDNYLKNFSAEFLFLSGDGNPRHNMIQSGYLYLAEIVTLLLGFGYLLREKKVLWLLLGWVLVAPLATALVEGPHGLRSLMMLTPLIMLSGAGMATLSKTRPWLWLILILIGIQLILNLERLYLVSPTNLGRFWSSDAKEAVRLVGESQTKYDYLILSTRVDNLEYAYPVYSQLDPAEVIKMNQDPVLLNGVAVKQFSKVYLLGLSDSQVSGFLDKLTGSYLYLGPPADQSVLEGSNVINRHQRPILTIKSSQ